MESDIIVTETSLQTCKRAVMIRCILISALHLFYRKAWGWKQTKNEGQFNGLAPDKWAKHKLLRNIWWYRACNKECFFFVSVLDTELLKPKDCLIYNMPLSSTPGFMLMRWLLKSLNENPRSTHSEFSGRLTRMTPPIKLHRDRRPCAQDPGPVLCIPSSGSSRMSFNTSFVIN